MEICQRQAIFLADDIVGVHLIQCRIILGMAPLYDGNAFSLRVDVCRVVAEVDISGANVSGKPQPAEHFDLRNCQVFFQKRTDIAVTAYGL